MAMDTMGEVGVMDNYASALVPNTQSRSGPCDDLMDPTERRIGLPGVWGTFALLWHFDVPNPATTLTLNTTIRRIGTAGLTDAGATVQTDLGFNVTLDETLTSISQGGFFYPNFDFIFHSVAIQTAGPLYRSTANAVVATANTFHTGPLFTTIEPYSDQLQSLLFGAFMESFRLTLSVDSETKCDWMSLPMPILGAGFGLSSCDTASNGAQVQGNKANLRVNYRARGGSTNGRDTTKRLILTFARNVDSAVNAPVVNIPGGINVSGVGGTVCLVQLIKVYMEGCPVLPLPAADAGFSKYQNLQAENEMLKAQLAASAGPAAPAAQGFYARPYPGRR